MVLWSCGVFELRCSWEGKCVERGSFVDFSEERKEEAVLSMTLFVVDRYRWMRCWPEWSQRTKAANHFLTDLYHGPRLRTSQSSSSLFSLSSMLSNVIHHRLCLAAPNISPPPQKTPRKVSIPCSTHPQSTIPHPPSSSYRSLATHSIPLRFINYQSHLSCISQSLNNHYHTQYLSWIEF